MGDQLIGQQASEGWQIGAAGVSGNVPEMAVQGGEELPVVGVKGLDRRPHVCLLTVSSPSVALQSLVPSLHLMRRADQGRTSLVCDDLLSPTCRGWGKGEAAATSRRPSDSQGRRGTDRGIESLASPEPGAVVGEVAKRYGGTGRREAALRGGRLHFVGAMRAVESSWQWVANSSRGSRGTQAVDRGYLDLAEVDPGVRGAEPDTLVVAAGERAWPTRHSWHPEG
jgi:hypothetical protein